MSLFFFHNAVFNSLTGLLIQNLVIFIKAECFIWHMQKKIFLVCMHNVDYLISRILIFWHYWIWAQVQNTFYKMTKTQYQIRTYNSKTKNMTANLEKTLKGHA